VLQCVTLWCIVLLCVPLSHLLVLQHFYCCSKLQTASVSCSELQCVAVNCSLLQCVAVHATKPLVCSGSILIVRVKIHIWVLTVYVYTQLYTNIYDTAAAALLLLVDENTRMYVHIMSLRVKTIRLHTIRYFYIYNDVHMYNTAAACLWCMRSYGCIAI